MLVCQSTPLSATIRSCSCGRRSWKWPRTPSSGATCTSRIAWSTSPIACTTTAWKSWCATRGRASIAAGLPHAAVAGDPFTHLDVREKLGLRAGGFGLLICQGMVDEMRYNDPGNEVTLIKRFASSPTFDSRRRMSAPSGNARRTSKTNRGNVGSPQILPLHAACPGVDLSRRQAAGIDYRRQLRGSSRGAPARNGWPCAAERARAANRCLSWTTSPTCCARSRTCLRIDYQVITCERGATRSKSCGRPRAIHVILSDQRMPGMTGVEVLRQAKAIRPETTRLLFTAYADIRTVIDAINQGHVFRYLAKPWDPDELEAVVRQAVEHHDLIVEKNRLLAELQETNAKLLEANRLKGGVHRGRQPRAQHAGHRGAGHDRALEDVARRDAPARRSASGSIGSAPRPGRLARTVERMLKLVRNREFSQSLDDELARARAARAQRRR